MMKFALYQVKDFLLRILDLTAMQIWFRTGLDDCNLLLLITT